MSLSVPNVSLRIPGLMVLPITSQLCALLVQKCGIVQVGWEAGTRAWAGTQGCVALLSCLKTNRIIVEEQHVPGVAIFLYS